MRAAGRAEGCAARAVPFWERLGTPTSPQGRGRPSLGRGLRAGAVWVPARQLGLEARKVPAGQVSGLLLTILVLVLETSVLVEKFNGAAQSKKSEGVFSPTPHF